MDQYFTTRQGAIRRLMEIRREIAGMTSSPITVIGHRNDGLEIRGVENVLLNVRTGRVLRFVLSGAAEDQIVFITWKRSPRGVPRSRPRLAFDRYTHREGGRALGPALVAIDLRGHNVGVPEPFPDVGHICLGLERCRHRRVPLWTVKRGRSIRAFSD
jgi:hypothetical protein